MWYASIASELELGDGKCAEGVTSHLHVCSFDLINASFNK